MNHNELIKKLFVALHPKLGGGGITPTLMRQVREIAIPQLNDEQRKICGEEPHPCPTE